MTYIAKGTKDLSVKCFDIISFGIPAYIYLMLGILNMSCIYPMLKFVTTVATSSCRIFPSSVIVSRHNKFVELLINLRTFFYFTNGAYYIFAYCIQMRITKQINSTSNLSNVFSFPPFGFSFTFFIYF